MSKDDLSAVPSEQGAPTTTSGTPELSKSLAAILYETVNVQWQLCLMASHAPLGRKAYGEMKADANPGELVVMHFTHPKQPKEDCIGWLIETGERDGWQTWTIEKLTGGEITWENVKVLRAITEVEWETFKPISRMEAARTLLTSPAGRITQMGEGGGS